MPLRSFSFLVLALLVLSQAGMALWRYYPIKPSTAPVFSYPPAVEKFDSPGDMTGAIQAYQADRGAECKLTAADGTQLTVFYFEWDRLASDLKTELAGHSPEVCNVAAGFQLGELAPNRSFQVPGQPPLVFDSSRFIDPAGKNMFVFKMPWSQGIGSLQLRQGESRLAHLKTTLRRHIGAARMLQGSVFNARDSDHAWQIFQSEVLEKLEWR